MPFINIFFFSYDTANDMTHQCEENGKLNNIKLNINAEQSLFDYEVFLLIQT